MDFRLLLNEALLPTVVAMPPVERRRFREKLEFLGAGLWDTGVRVKKLKGLSRKVVFEARLNRGDRLLFTLGRERGKPLVYVWSLVSHDDIDRGARAVSGDAPFLRFDPSEIEERTELALADLTEEHYSQEPLEAKTREEYGPQKWLVLDDAEWERLLKATPTDDLAVHLYLTQEQERVLAQELPLLLSGTAGSGKTTIAVYSLLRPDHRAGRRLFVTYSAHLARFSERIYRGLTRHAAVVEPDDVEFVVLRDLVTRLLGDRRGDVADFRLFERILRDHALARSWDPELVWEEIRSIIKGAKPALSFRRLKDLAQPFLDGTIAARDLLELRATLLDLTRLEPFSALMASLPDWGAWVRGLGADGVLPEDRGLVERTLEIAHKRGQRLEDALLSYDEYAALGAKRAPRFRHDRKVIYGIATWYQERLAELGQEDDVDRARRAHAQLTRGRKALYDLVVCDEAQDLCDLEISLLARLAREPRNLVLAGDVKQTINPSGFRWEDVRRGFYERGLPVPGVSELTLNFRCVGSIVRLANGLLELKQRLVGLASGERAEEWKFNGSPPVLLSGPSEAEVLELVDLRVPGRIVITRGAAERDVLKRSLRTELVFTIHEAKGLEFDTVLLWRFSGDASSAELWRKTVARSESAGEHTPHLGHELALLYVGLTRARNGLVIYDGETASPLWKVPELDPHVVRSSEAATILRLWRHATEPGEWERQADYFWEREYWRAAEECYRNAGMEARSRAARARAFATEGRHGEAAEIYLADGLNREAAECLETGGELERAMELWKGLGEGERFRLCRVRLYEERGQHELAGDEWARLGNREEALRCWEIAGAWDRVAVVWREWKQYRRAATAFERAGMRVEAAECWELARETGRAAEVFVQARAWDRAAALYRRLGDEEKLLACYRQIPDHRGAAEILWGRGEVESAVKELEAHLAEHTEQVAALRAEVVERPKGTRMARESAVKAAALGDHRLAAALFEQAELPEPALARWRLAGDPLGAARALSAMGRAGEAAAAAESASGPVELVERYLRQWRAADPGALRADAVSREAAGDLVAALARYRVLGDEPKVVEISTRLDGGRHALALYLDGGRYREALDLLGGDGAPTPTADDLRRLLARPAPEPETQAGRWYLELGARLALEAVGGEAEAQARVLLDLAGAELPAEPIPAIVDLALRLRHYGVLQHLVATGEGHEVDAELVERLRLAAADTGDPGLWACWASVADPDRHDGHLAGVTLDERTVALFEVSEARHHEAAAHHLGRGAWQRAALVYRAWGEHAAAAQIHEGHGERAVACRLYRTAGEYAKALSCARVAGDEVEMALAHEGLGEHRRALDLWLSLGRGQDAERVREVMRKATR